MRLRTSATYQYLPRLTDGQYEALRSDIAAHGIRHPIVVDEKGLILDGHHRAEIAKELGIDPPHEQMAGLSEQEKRDLVFTLNGARRHFNVDQLREFVVKSLIADPELSDRQHARRTGVSHPTVSKLRAELEAGGQLESLTSRIGADGRERPATQPKRVAPTDSPAAAPDLDQPDPKPAEALPPGSDDDVTEEASPPEAEGVSAPEAGGTPGAPQHAEDAPGPTPVTAQLQEHLAKQRQRAQEVENHNQWARKVNADLHPETRAELEDLQHRVDAVMAILLGCEALIREVRDVDPVAAVAGAPSDMLPKLAVVNDALDFLRRAADALQSMEVSV